MQSPSLMRTPKATATSVQAASQPAAAAAREIISHLNAWAAQCPHYRQALDDCTEEIAWGARLSPAPAAPHVAELKHGTKQILTLLHLWAQIRPPFSRSLLACAEEIELLAAQHERKDDSARTRDKVFLTFETAAVVLTSKQIADLTGLRLRRVQRALGRLEQLGLVKDVGCAAQCHADGFRLRQWTLTH